MVDEDGFIEWWNVHDKMYGTAVKELERIQELKRIPIFEIDVQGAQKVHERKLGCNFLFILPCENVNEAESVLRERLEARDTETPEQINTRVKNSKEEIDKYKESKFFQYTLVNDDLNKATDRLYEIIEKAYKGEVEEWRKIHDSQ